MFDIALRRLKDVLVDPCARIVPRFITPAHITLTAFICGILSCISAASAPLKSYALWLWVSNRFLDCLDGSVARTRNKMSTLGGFLDLLSDFIVYSLLPISIAWGQSMKDPLNEYSWLSIALLEASFHVNNFILFYGAAVAAQRDDRELTSVTMRPALIEGFESGLIFTVMLVWPEYIARLSCVMSAGVTIGICQRTWAIAGALQSRIDERRDQ